MLGLRGLVSGLRGLTAPKGVSIAGRALTVRFMPVRGRSIGALKLYDAISRGKPGDFLVIEAPYPEEVVVGDLVVTATLAAKFVGILLDGYARDVAAVTNTSIGIWARGSSLVRSNHLEVESIGQPIVCGGAQVRTGDLVVADADGAVIVPPEELDAVTRAVAHIETIERELKSAIQRSASPLEISELLSRKSRIPNVEL